MQRGKILVAGLLAVGYAFWGRRKLLTWGATPLEGERLACGDELIAQAQLQATRGVTIDAALDAVWPWLAQMGRERSGFYGIDRLDNWNIPSVTYIRRDIAPLAVGMALDNGLKILDFAPGRYLLVGGFDLPNDMGGTTDITFLYWLEALSHDQTRLTVRMRCTGEGTLNWLYLRLVELLDTLMTVAQLRGIKQRAESMVRQPEILQAALAEMPGVYPPPGDGGVA